ncbi:MAG: GNAT family N-acetyltransferase [Candidatus Pacearchaeota archaeon]
MKIRKADKKDLRKIGLLMKAEFSKPPFNEKVSIDAVLKSLNFYDKIGKIVVADIENKIVGVIVFKIEQFWEGPAIIIEDLAVVEKNKDIGKMLIDYVESYGKKKSVKHIEFLTPKKSPAVKFYEKYGYKINKNRIYISKKIK